MKRRDFLVTSAAAGLGLAARPAATPAADATGGKQILDLRTYHFDSPAKMAAFEEFVAKVAIPAIRRAGVGPVGAFKLLKADNPDLKLEADPLELRVLRPHASLESFVLLPRAMGADATFLREAAGVWDAPKTNAPYTRYETTLLLSFDAMPKVEVPAKGPDRVFQLRIYESHSEERARKKIEMFNGGGEIDIFRRCGLNPVFFGQTLAGTRMPNLHYMVGFADKAAQEKAWKTFGADPGWVKLKDDPAYKDTVSNITNLILRPAAGSEI
jgi:hypothetical protein